MDAYAWMIPLPPRASLVGRLDRLVFGLVAVGRRAHSLHAHSHLDVAPVSCR